MAAAKSEIHIYQLVDELTTIRHTFSGTGQVSEADINTYPLSGSRTFNMVAAKPDVHISQDSQLEDKI